MISKDKKRRILAELEPILVLRKREVAELEKSVVSLRQELCDHEWKYKQIAGEGSYCIHCNKENFERD